MAERPKASNKKGTYNVLLLLLDCTCDSIYIVFIVNSTVFQEIESNLSSLDKVAKISF